LPAAGLFACAAPACAFAALPPVWRQRGVLSGLNGRPKTFIAKYFQVFL